MLPGEGHEAEVHRVEHELDRHEDDERAPPHQDTDEPDGEEQRRDELVGLERHGQGLHQANFRFASTTAPMTAIRSRIEVTSKGKSHVE